jgi:ElaB/YqjD/DUF883 family membrane-anchored ribosome-binding protein
MNDTATVNSTRALADDFNDVVADTQALLRHAARDAGEGYDDARQRLERSLKAMREQLDTLEKTVVDKAKSAGHATDSYVHEHPWQAAGIGAGVGLLLGMLIARR